MQEYEDTNGIKLYSFGAVPLLTAIFMADAERIMIPNVLSSIFASFGATTGTVAGAVSSAGNASAVSVASSAGMAAAEKASKLGIKGLIKTTK